MYMYYFKFYTKECLNCALVLNVHLYTHFIDALKFPLLYICTYRSTLPRYSQYLCRWSLSSCPAPPTCSRWTRPTPSTIVTTAVHWYVHVCVNEVCYNFVNCRKCMFWKVLIATKCLAKGFSILNT